MLCGDEGVASLKRNEQHKKEDVKISMAGARTHSDSKKYQRSSDAQGFRQVFSWRVERSISF